MTVCIYHQNIVFSAKKPAKGKDTESVEVVEITVLNRLL